MTPATEFKLNSLAQIHSLIDRFLTVGVHHHSLTSNVAEQELIDLCAEARQVFLSQPPMIEIRAPVRILGDLHGQYPDLLRLLNTGGFPPSMNYLFLGDYVDRGKQSIETISLLLCYKVVYPDHMFLLRGNHEITAINRVYGFYDECARRYTLRLWQAFQQTFACMPLTALVARKILCMHGGLSPRLEKLKQLRHIERPLDPAVGSLPQDVLWSDPDENAHGFEQSRRGAAFVFGLDVVRDCCAKMRLELIARAHQVVSDGYEFFADRRLVTIFSAPNYCGEFENAAGMMFVDKNLECSFHVLRPTQRASMFVREAQSLMRVATAQSFSNENLNRTAVEVHLGDCNE